MYGIILKFRFQHFGKILNVISGIILSPECTVCLSDRLAISDERNPVDSRIKPCLFTNYINRHIPLSGNDFKPCFLNRIRKKIVTFYSNNIFIIGLFFPLSGWIHDKDAGNIFQFGDFYHFQSAQRIMVGNFYVHTAF